MYWLFYTSIIIHQTEGIVFFYSKILIKSVLPHDYGMGSMSILFQTLQFKDYTAFQKKNTTNINRWSNSSASPIRPPTIIQTLSTVPVMP